MKKITALICAFLCFAAAQAQDKSIFTQSTIDNCAVAVDSLLAGSKRQYVFGESYPVGTGRYALDFKEVDNTDKIRAVIQELTVGANPDMEIEGTKVYQISSIIGSFVDLFPIWKKYVDADADMEQVLALPNYNSPEKKITNADGKSGVDFRFKRSGQEKGSWVFEYSPWRLM